MGSNTPDAADRLRRALRWLATVATDIRATDIYPTEAVGGATGSYLNLVAECLTTLSADEFERQAKSMERREGRERHSHTVSLDIDLVSHDGVDIRPGEYSRSYFREGLRRLSEIP